MLLCHTACVRVELTNEIDRWLTRLEGQANGGNAHASEQLDYVTAALELLDDLTEPPTTESVQLKRVRQSRQHQLWRTSHPFHRGIAIRLICWFPPDADSVVVAVLAGDKARIGDVFYDSVGTRADAAINTWLMHREEEEDRGRGR